MNQVDAEREQYGIPNAADMFSCFAACPLEAIQSMVIIGQDPYHGRSRAHSMSFRLSQGVKLPPESLQNILRSWLVILGTDMPTNGLEPWGKQGVLLMNTGGASGVVRLVATQIAAGWNFSKNLLTMLNDYEQPLVFILWGAHAQRLSERLQTAAIWEFIVLIRHRFSANRSSLVCSHFRAQ